ncbi:hypothetical protein GCM10027418_02860 [Mariniluteicoccus endophyticus]
MTVQPIVPLQRRPLDLGSSLSGSFILLKRKAGLFLGLAAMPMALGTMVSIAALVPIIIGITQSIAQQEVVWPLVLGGVGLFAVGMLAVSLFQMRTYAMMSIATEEYVSGRDPFMSTLWSRSKGFVVRLLALVLCVWLAVMVLYGLLVAAVLGFVAAVARNAQDESSVAAALSMLVLAVFGFYAALFALLFLMPKVIYTVPAMALEGLDGFAGVKRAWSVTRGNYWRTFGWYLALAGILYLLNSTIAIIANMFSPLYQLQDEQQLQSDPEAALRTVMTAMVPMLIVVSVLSIGLSLVSVPLRQIYLTLMFMDQRVRNEMIVNGTIPRPGAYGPAYAAYPQQVQQGWPQQQPPQGWPQGAPQQVWPQQPSNTYQPQRQEPPYGQQGWPQG